MASDRAAELPRSDLRERAILAEARAQARAVVQYRELFRYLVWSSLRTENAGTLLGFLWWIVDPLLLMLVYVALVDVILKRGGPNFAVFVLTAIVAWDFFTKGTRNAMNTTARKDRQMRQVAFPRSVLPLAAVTADAIHFLFALVVLVVVAIGFGILPHPIDFAVLLVVAVQFVLTLGTAYFFSALNVFFRDTGHVLNYLYRFWFFLSPSLYTVDRVPERFRAVFELNPYATIFPAYRSLVLDHEMPDLAALGMIAAFSAGVLAAAYVFFIRLEPKFAKVSR